MVKLQVFVVFEEYVNKKVRIIKTDGFVKYGRLLFSDNETKFVKIEFDVMSKTEFIAFSAISAISLVD